jgi:hypothetical protein
LDSIGKYPVGYLPPKTYAYMVRLQEEYKLSIKEVQRILINKVLHDLGFKCNHERIGYAKSDKEPYCKDCWTRLRKVNREPYRIGDKLIKHDIQYLDKETFLDEFYRDRDKDKNKDAKTKKRQEQEQRQEQDESLSSEC